VYAIVKSDAPAPAYRDAVLASLGAAVEMANTPEYDNLYSGFAAYKNWAARLRSADVEMDEMLGNGYTYGSLWNQRDMASRYLAQVAPLFGEDVASHLREASRLYKHIYEVMAQPRPGLRNPWMYMPWDLRGEWTPQQREVQAVMLDEIAEIEQQAIHEIELAITSTPTTQIQTAAEPPSPTASQ
jgi:hypothetical protein